MLQTLNILIEKKLIILIDYNDYIVKNEQRERIICFIFILTVRFYYTVYIAKFSIFQYL